MELQQPHHSVLSSLPELKNHWSHSCMQREHRFLHHCLLCELGTFASSPPSVLTGKSRAGCNDQNKLQALQRFFTYLKDQNLHRKSERTQNILSDLKDKRPELTSLWNIVNCIQLFSFRVIKALAVPHMHTVHCDHIHPSFPHLTSLTCFPLLLTSLFFPTRSTCMYVLACASLTQVAVSAVHS